MSFSLTGLDAGTDYQVRSSLTDPITDGTTNATATFTTLATPAALGAVTVESKTHNSASIMVRITNANSTLVYLQYRKKDTDSWTDVPAQTAAAGTANVTFSLTGLDASTQYEIRASLTDPISDTTTNEAAKFTTLAAPALGSATMESKTHNSASIQVAITNANDTSVYLQYKKTADSGWTDVTAQTATSGDTSVSFTLEGLDASTSYEVRASLTDPIPSSTASIITFTTSGAPALGSASVKSKAHNSVEIEVSITLANDTMVYLQYKKTTEQNWTNATSQTAVSGATSVSFTLKGLDANTAYQVRASLASSITDSTANKTAEFTTLGAPTLGTPTVGSKTHNSATISVPITNANDTSVYLEYKKTVDQAWTDVSAQTAASGVTSVSFILKGLDANMEYQVRASLTSLITDDTTNVTATFTTAAAPVLGSATVESKTHNSASIMVGITNANDTSVYLEYKKTVDPEWTNVPAQTAASGATSVSFTLKGLDANTAYQVRASLTSPITDDTTNVTATFTTAVAPVLGSAAVESRTHDAATVKVTISNANDTPVYLQYKKTTASEWTDATSQTAASEDASVSFSLTGLDASIGYQVRASLESTITDTTTNVTATFTTLGAPTLGTATVESRTHDAATVKVTISNANDTPVYLQYKKTTASEWTDATSQTAASEDASVSFSLTGLDASIGYQVRASLESTITDTTTNVTATFTTLGAPTLGTATVESRTHDAASIKVAISNANDTPVYLQYKKTTASEWTDATSQTAASEDASVSFSLTGLDASIGYQVRASLESTITDTTTNVTATFTTLGAPTLGTATVESRTHDAASIKVAISNANDTPVYLQYKKTTASEWTDATSQTAASEDASVSFSLTNLDANTDYEVRASLSDPISDTTTNVTTTFTTSVTPPAIGSVSVESKTHNAASIKVAISNADDTPVYLQYKKTTASEWTEVSPETASSEDTSVSFSLTGLDAGIGYQVRASLESPITDSTMNVTATFTTDESPPVVTEISVSDKERTTAKVTVTISNPAGTMTVHLEYNIKDSTADPLSQTETTTTGTAEFDLEGLNANTTYTVKASLDNTFPTAGTASDEFTTETTVPAAPSITSISDGDGQFTVNWSAPADNGGEAVSGYKVQHKESGEDWDDATTSASTTALTLEVTGLDNGATYDVRVIATNANGDSEPSAESSVDLIDVPGAPTGVTLSRGDSGELDVSWTAPTIDGLHPVDTYVVRWKSGADDYGSPNEAEVTTTTHKITGLENGTEYTVKVNAKNGRGESANSNEPDETPGTMPGAPQNLRITPKAHNLTVVWEAPADDGGFDISEYRVQWKKTDAQVYKASDEAPVQTLTYTITNLESETAYTVRVIAVNDIGRTETPPEVEISTGEDPSISGVDVPDGGDDVAKRTTAVATVTIANRDEDEATTVYLRYSEDTDPLDWIEIPSKDTNADTVQFDIDSLMANTSYIVQASLDNTFSSGGFASDTFLTASTVPGQVTGITYESLARRTDPDDGDVWEVRLSWAAPDDGGSSITGYSVAAALAAESLEEEINVVGQTLTATFDAGGHGKIWVVNVLASNANGEGEASAEVNVEWTQVPEAPTITVALKSGQLTVSWTEPDTGGRTIENYLVRWVESGEDITSATPAEVAGSARDHPISSLTNGTTYDVSVAAKNSVGQGDWSAVATGTPVAEAGAPTLTDIAHGDGTLGINWEAPEGDTPVDNFIVQWVSGEDDFDSTDVQGISSSVNTVRVHDSVS